MPYDWEDEADKSPWCHDISDPDLDPRQALCVLIELSVIYLTPHPSSTFTLEELWEEVRGIADGKILVDLELAREIIDESKLIERASQCDDQIERWKMK